MHIMSWKGHIVRSANQDRARTDALEKLDEKTVLIVNDWAMSLKLIGLENEVHLGTSRLCTAVVMGTSNGRASFTLFNHVVKAAVQ